MSWRGPRRLRGLRATAGEYQRAARDLFRPYTSPLGPVTAEEYAKKLAFNARLSTHAATRQAVAKMEKAHSRPLSISHYTDAAGALGIIQTQELWATHALYMNDASELVSARPILAEACGTVLEAFDKPVKETFEAAFWSGYYKSDHYVKERHPEVYVVCFCEDPDLLSQWRAYGHVGGGFSIQLDFEALSADVDSTTSVSLLPVIYDQAEQRQYALSLIGAATELIASLESPREDIFLTQVDSVGSVAGEAASRFSLHVKNASFAEEKEWRLVYTRPYEDPLSGFEIDENLERQYRTNRRGIVPYVGITTNPRLRVEPWSPRLRRFPMTSVTVGPTASADLAQRAMTSLLEDHSVPRYWPKVLRSKIPLRV